MPKQMGSPKTGGRRSGTPNKKSVAMAEILESCGLDPVKKLVNEILPALEPEGQAKVLLELTTYLYPKRKAIEVSGPSGANIPVSHKVDFSAIAKENPDAIEALLKAEKILSGIKKGEPDA